MSFPHLSNPRPGYPANIPDFGTPSASELLKSPAITPQCNTPQYRTRPLNHLLQNTMHGSSQQKQEHRGTTRARFYLFQILCLFAIILYIVWAVWWAARRRLGRMVGITKTGRGVGVCYADKGDKTGFLNGNPKDTCFESFKSSSSSDDNGDDDVDDDSEREGIKDGNEMHKNRGILKRKAGTRRKKSGERNKYHKTVRWVDEEGGGELFLTIVVKEVGVISAATQCPYSDVSGDDIDIIEEIKEDERYITA